jgi:hypothetical protein
VTLPREMRFRVNYQSPSMSFSNSVCDKRRFNPSSGLERAHMFAASRDYNISFFELHLETLMPYSMVCVCLLYRITAQHLREQGLPLLVRVACRHRRRRRCTSGTSSFRSRSTVSLRHPSHHAHNGQEEFSSERGGGVCDFWGERTIIYA